MESYATEDVIPETVAEIMWFTQRPHKTPIEYSELLLVEALPCHPMYDEYVLKGKFTEGLQHSIRQEHAFVLGFEQACNRTKRVVTRNIPNQPLEWFGLRVIATR